jgi:hypothetical protein
MVSILLDNNLLKKNKGPFERRQGLTINWVCVTQNCYYRATTVEDCVAHTNGQHNHDPNIEEFHKREGRVQLKKAVAISDAPLAAVCLFRQQFVQIFVKWIAFKPIMKLLHLGCSQCDRCHI